MITRVLEKMGPMVRACGMMYKAVVQSVLLYVSEIWVVTGAMLRVLEEFHQRMTRRITVRTVTCGAGWE